MIASGVFRVLLCPPDTPLPLEVKKLNNNVWCEKYAKVSEGPNKNMPASCQKHAGVTIFYSLI